MHVIGNSARAYSSISKIWIQSNIISNGYKRFRHQNIDKYVKKRWFKSSIEIETKGTTRSTKYGQMLVSSMIGSMCFFALANYKIQKRLSNVINERFCLDYYELKESYRCYLNDNPLNVFHRSDPMKRVLALIIDSFAVGFVVGIIGSPMWVSVGIVLFSAKYFNQQSPGFMLMGLRAIYIEDENNNDRFESDTVSRTEWKAQMDYTSFIRRQFAFYPIELGIYIVCLGSMSAATIVSTIVYSSHIAQFYASTNRTWLDKWAKIQVIDVTKLQVQ